MSDDDDEIQEIINPTETTNQTDSGETDSGAIQDVFENTVVSKSLKTNDEPRRRSQKIMTKPSSNDDHAIQVSDEDNEEPKITVGDVEEVEETNDESEEEEVPVAANHKWRWQGSKPPKRMYISKEKNLVNPQEISMN